MRADYTALRVGVRWSCALITLPGKAAPGGVKKGLGSGVVTTCGWVVGTGCGGA